MLFSRASYFSVTSSTTMLRYLSNRAALQGRRTFATYGNYYSNSKREMQTSTAYQPHTLPSSFPPPTTDGALSASFTKSASSSSSDTSNHDSSLSASGQKPEVPTASASASPKESEAAKPKPAAAAASAPKAEKPRRKLKARKAAIKLTPIAVERLQALFSQPDPRMVRVGTKNKGCSGLTYHLEYVDKPHTFDEVIEQDGVKIFIDSKALFSIIGSEMDWTEDHLNQKFTFKNPNIKEQCGCGESFMV